MVVRRVGGGYGGKISRATQIACAAALVTHLSNKTCRMILPLETNMRAIGKRIPTKCKFEVTFLSLVEKYERKYFFGLVNKFYYYLCTSRLV